MKGVLAGAVRAARVQQSWQGDLAAGHGQEQARAYDQDEQAGDRLGAGARVGVRARRAAAAGPGRTGRSSRGDRDAGGQRGREPGPVPAARGRNGGEAGAAVVAAAVPVVLAAAVRPAESVEAVWPGVRVALVVPVVLAAPLLMTPVLPVAAVVTDPVAAGPAGVLTVRTGRTPPEPVPVPVPVPVSARPGAAARARARQHWGQRRDRRGDRREDRGQRRQHRGQQSRAAGW